MGLGVVTWVGKSNSDISIMTVPLPGRQDPLILRYSICKIGIVIPSWLECCEKYIE